MSKFKFNVLNKAGEEEAWSGIFETAKDARIWFLNHGKFHKNRGHRLVLKKLSPSDKINKNELYLREHTKESEA